MLKEDFFAQHPLACATELIGCELRLGTLQRNHRRDRSLHGHRRRSLPHVPAARGAEVRGHASGRHRVHLPELRGPLALNVLVKGGDGRLRVDPRAGAAAGVRSCRNAVAWRTRSSFAPVPANSPRRWRSRRRSTAPACATIHAGRFTRVRTDERRRRRIVATCASASHARRNCRGAFLGARQPYVSRVRPGRAVASAWSNTSEVQTKKPDCPRRNDPAC